MNRLRGKISIETYTDASFSNVKDGNSQIGFVVGEKMSYLLEVEKRTRSSKIHYRG